MPIKKSYYLVYSFNGLTEAELKRIIQEIRDITGMEPQVLDESKKPVRL